MDVCVITFRNSDERVAPAVRRQDRLWLRDNTVDNIGFAAAANELASRGEDPLILFINPDLDPEPGLLDALEGGLRENDRVAVAGVDGAYQGADFDAEWLSGACLAVRRLDFESIGGFDESLFMYAEDVDLCYRLADRGRLSYIAAARHWHDTGQRPFKSEYRQARNFIVVQRRHGRPGALVPTLRAGIGSLCRGHFQLGMARVLGSAASIHRK